MEVQLLFKIAAIGILVAVLHQVLVRAGREDQAMMTTLAGIVIVLSIVIKEISTLFNNVRTHGNKDKDYIVRLVKYFSNIYDNVEFTIAAGIANVESGYVSKYMLNKNNIFGGMYNGNLIGYKNIEYGTLQYVKLLSEGYFGKGLTTVEDIGRIYNPMFNESGVKIAKPTWVYNVKLAMENFNDIEDVDTTILNNLKNS